MPQILLIGGWYDIFLDDQIEDYLYMSSVDPVRTVKKIRKEE